MEVVLALAAKSTWECHPDANFCSDQFVSLRMRKMELKRMKKRILMMWMKKKKVVMRMKVGIIALGRMGIIKLWKNRRSWREIPPLNPSDCNYIPLNATSINLLFPFLLVL